MLVSPYDTTICQPYKVEKILNAATRANIEAPLPSLTTPMGNEVRDAVFVSPKDEYDDVPSFTQFINIGKPNAPKWVVDGRAFMRWDRRTDSYRLTAENDFSFQCARIALTQHLVENGGESFNRLGDIPVKTFVRWITLGLSQRFNLPLDTQIRMSIICAYYYFSQLESNRALDEEARVQYANRISRICQVPAPMVLEVGDQVGALTTANDLALALAQHTATVRLESLKFIDMFTMLAPSWVGVSSRENVGVALEHMPTFIAMVYTALGERSYRKTIIAKRAETTGRQADIKQFVDQVYRQVESRFI